MFFAYEIDYALSTNELFMQKMKHRIFDNLYKQLRDAEKCIDASKKVRERILWLKQNAYLIVELAHLLVK